jgi:hypothetical protein
MVPSVGVLFACVGCEVVRCVFDGSVVFNVCRLLLLMWCVAGVGRCRGFLMTFLNIVSVWVRQYFSDLIILRSWCGCVKCPNLVCVTM